MSEQGYRSSRITPADDAVILPPAARGEGPPRERLVRAALDLAVLPLVAVRPAPKVEVLGEQLRIDRDFKRWAWRTERGIELAIARRALEQHRPTDVLEVGNVLPLAGNGEHLVVDKYEQGPNVVNEDIVDFAPDRRYALVISISTVEHVGWDEVPVEREKAAQALVNMASMVADDGSLLVTVPVGYHREFEAFVTSDGSPLDHVELLVKTSRSARWERRPVDERLSITYGRPYACANAVLVGVIGSPFKPDSPLSA